MLANSNFTATEWKAILPDLFASTEFLLFPQYQNVAIENVVGGNNAIYSPVGDMAAMIEQVVADSFQYDPTYVRGNAQHSAFPYMSVGVASIGHQDNRDGKNKLQQWFPDYFFTNTGSVDFKRMTANTQSWVMMIVDMLRIARDLTTGSTVPIGYSRSIRGNRLYLVKSFNNVQFMVASPVSMAVIQ